MGSKLGRFRKLFSQSDASSECDELSSLCPLCLSMLDDVMERAKSHLDGSHRQTFGNRREWKRVFEVKQTIHQLQLAAESNACHFCYLRWEHLCDHTDASQRLLAANDAYEADVRWRDNKPEAWNVTLLYEVGGFQSMSRFKFQSEVKRNRKPTPKQNPAVNRDNMMHDLSLETQDQKWEVARIWLKECTEGHSVCSNYGEVEKDSSFFYPTRLVDIGPGPDLRPRLRESYSLPPGTRYMTLSHCWGKLKILRLLKNNIEDLKHVIDTSLLCETFLDAMEATRMLGVRYLWIDSLCIMQDSKDDWAHESGMMHNVYRHSWCNLAATSAEDGSFGMLRHLASRNDMSARPIRVKMRVKSKDIIFVGYNETLWLDQIDRGPLKSRGWVVQELTLAPRVLHFGKHQLFWDCPRLRACETLQSGPVSEFEIMNCIAPGCIMAPENFKNKSKLKAKEAYRWSRIAQWMELVEEYSKCRLTVATDRLVAISGLAKSMNLGVKYYAGIWGAFVAKQLMWQISESNPRRANPPSSALAPSWSWVTPQQTILFKTNRWGEGDSGVANFLKIGVTLVSDDPTGAVSGGCLRVEGALVSANKDYSHIDLHFDYGDDSQPVDNLYLLPVMWQVFAGDYSGLILERTRNANGQYRRRGWFATKFHEVRYQIPRVLKDAQDSFKDQCFNSINTLTTKHYESVKESPKYGHMFTITLV